MVPDLILSPGHERGRGARRAAGSGTTAGTVTRHVRTPTQSRAGPTGQREGERQREAALARIDDDKAEALCFFLS